MSDKEPTTRLAIKKSTKKWLGYYKLGEETWNQALRKVLAYAPQNIELLRCDECGEEIFNIDRNNVAENIENGGKKGTHVRMMLPEGENLHFCDINCFMNTYERWNMPVEGKEVRVKCLDCDWVSSWMDVEEHQEKIERIPIDEEHEVPKITKEWRQHFDEHDEEAKMRKEYREKSKEKSKD